MKSRGNLLGQFRFSRDENAREQGRKRVCVVGVCVCVRAHLEVLGEHGGCVAHKTERHRDVLLVRACEKRESVRKNASKNS